MDDSVIVINIKRARSALSILKNKKVALISRSLDLVEICFENVYFIMEDNMAEIMRQERTVSYILHLQCPFVIQQENSIVLESDDVYEVTDSMFHQASETHRQGNLFDEKLIQNRGTLYGSQVSKVSLNCDTLRIELNNDLTIQIGLCDDPNEESWRFFKLDDVSPHLIAYRNRFEIVD